MSVSIGEDMLQDLGAERAEELALAIEKVFNSIAINFTESGKLVVSQREVGAEIVRIAISAKMKKDGVTLYITRESDLHEGKR